MYKSAVRNLLKTGFRPLALKGYGGKSTRLKPVELLKFKFGPVRVTATDSWPSRDDARRWFLEQVRSSSHRPKVPFWLAEEVIQLGLFRWVRQWQGRFE